MIGRSVREVSRRDRFADGFESITEVSPGLACP
jgi:hypothetical protein